jgi:pimeloyl-ACP methyl ester carboxylesterase
VLNKAMIYPAITRRQSLISLLTFSSAICIPAVSKADRVRGGSEAEKQTSPWLTLPPTPRLPNPSRQGLVSINGVRIFFAQFGQGPSTLFLHGGLANSNYWGYQIDDISRNFLVTVMDTRGHGRSPLTSDTFGYGVFAKDALALMDYLQISRTTLVGWSDGAITGLQLALTQPSRLSGLFAFGANSNLEGLKAGGAHSGVFPSFSSRARKEYSELSPDPKKWSSLQQGLGKMWRREPNFSRAQLGTIKLPVTIADGEYEEIIKPEDTRQMAESIKGARLAILPSVSHFAMLQNPTRFNETIRKFLSSTG